MSDYKWELDITCEKLEFPRVRVFLELPNADPAPPPPLLLHSWRSFAIPAPLQSSMKIKKLDNYELELEVSNVLPKKVGVLFTFAPPSPPSFPHCPPGPRWIQGCIFEQDDEHLELNIVAIDEGIEVVESVEVPVATGTRPRAWGFMHAIQSHPGTRQGCRQRSTFQRRRVSWLSTTSGCRFDLARLENLQTHDRYHQPQSNNPSCLQVPHVRVLDKFGFPAFPEREGGEDGPPKKTFTMRIDFSNGQSLVWRWG